MQNPALNTFEEFERYLTNKKTELNYQILALHKDDPLLNKIVDESSELGTDSWQADVHIKVIALKNSLAQMLKNINESLEKIKQGTYGKCNKCGLQIEHARLKAMPQASICTACL